MSGGVFCRCPGTLAERRKNWKVNHRRHNHSAFNGWRYTPSDYSEVTCSACLANWRTKADYISTLPGNCVVEERE